MSVVEVLLALRADFGRKDARGMQAAEVAEALRWFVLFVFSVFLLCVFCSCCVFLAPSPAATAGHPIYRTASVWPPLKKARGRSYR